MLFECVQSSFASNFRISKLLQIKNENQRFFFLVHINLQGTSKQTEMPLTVALQDIKCTNILEVAYFYYELSIQPRLHWVFTIYTNFPVRILCTNNQRLKIYPVQGSYQLQTVARSPSIMRTFFIGSVA